MIFQGSSSTPVREAILHCAAIRTGQFDGMSPFQVFLTINKWHHERGFQNGFGYHAIVMPNGQWYSGRPLTMRGAHTIGRNKDTWGILLIEHRQIKKMGEFEDYYTDAQRRALRAWLRSMPQLEIVSGHNAYASKLCPGFIVQSQDWIG